MEFMSYKEQLKAQQADAGKEVLGGFDLEVLSFLDDGTGLTLYHIGQRPDLAAGLNGMQGVGGGTFESEQAAYVWAYLNEERLEAELGS